MKHDSARRTGRLSEPDEELDVLARVVVDSAAEVHRILGAGFVESVYEAALCCELRSRGVSFQRQMPVEVRYKGHGIGHAQLDLLVGERLVVELKAVEALGALHGVQVRSYLKATGCNLGLLINFNVPYLLQGVRRIILSTPDPGGPGSAGGRR
jgi:GxxExxY protein